MGRYPDGEGARTFLQREASFLRVVRRLLRSVLTSYAPASRAQNPEKYDLKGVRLVVWDALQSKYPGSADYSRGFPRDKQFLSGDGRRWTCMYVEA